MSDVGKNSIRTYLLTTNDIIIAKTNGIVHNDHLLIESPARLIHQRSNHGPLGFMLEPWVPNELLKEPTLMLDIKCIIAELHLSSAMSRFYRNWALAEVDKIKTFAEVFEKQIGDIEKKYLERTQDVKEKQQRSPMSSGASVTDAMIELFDSVGDEWGDPTVTH